MSGMPSFPDPTITTLEFEDFASSNVASIPFSFRILSVNDALRI